MFGVGRLHYTFCGTEKMVALKPAKFYGRLLPRPRIYCDVKFNDSRVDPPEPVNEKLLKWASEASWKMGGTAVKRKRMSGKIEGRMNKLRNMEESDEGDGTPTAKKAREILSSGKKKRERKESSGSMLQKPRTPIERMLESPGNAKVSKRGKLAPRRIISDDTPNQAPVVISRARRSRKEQPIPESDDDSDDDVEGFMLKLQSDKLTPNRSFRRSTRLQASPTPSLTPNSKRPLKNAPGSGDGRKSSQRSPLSLQRKRILEDSRSESDDEHSESVFL